MEYWCRVCDWQLVIINGDSCNHCLNRTAAVVPDWFSQTTPTPIDFDLEEIEAHEEMYLEHCIRVIGLALRRYCHEMV